MAHTMEHGLTKETQQCIDECLNCYSVCLQTVQHCLELGGKHADSVHIRTLNDCAEICQASAGFMLRGSQLQGQICGVCAEVCRACERSCRALGDDSMMQECADACRRCAESCDRMAKRAA